MQQDIMENLACRKFEVTYNLWWQAKNQISIKMQVLVQENISRVIFQHDFFLKNFLKRQR